MTDKKIKAVLESLTVIVDTRENENLHITDYFDRNGIKYVERKLDFGDYSFECPSIPELGITETCSFAKKIAIERKANLTELSGNLSQQRQRFENELIRAKDARAKLILMVENGDYSGIIEHKYRTDFNERSYLASLFSFAHRYNVEVQFIPSKYAGMFIYQQFYYYLREQLKQLEAV